jgi:integrase
LALEEDELLFQHRRDDLFIWPSVILGRLGGLRPAESRALTWEDVRFDERFIRIRGLGGKKSGRIIPLGQTLADELRDLHKAQTARKILGAFVSANAEGRATAKSVQIHRFEKLRRKIGLADDVTLYSLRRSHEQTLIDGGVRLEEAAQMMGHSPAVALKHYAQLNVIGRADFAEVAAGTWSNKGGKAACALPNALPRNP